MGEQRWIAFHPRRIRVKRSATIFGITISFQLFLVMLGLLVCFVVLTSAGAPLSIVVPVIAVIVVGYGVLFEMLWKGRTLWDLLMRFFRFSLRDRRIRR